MKLLMVDNYDSFTYNIVQYFGELGAQVQVFRNDEITQSLECCDGGRNDTPNQRVIAVNEVHHIIVGQREQSRQACNGRTHRNQRPRRGNGCHA